MARPKEKGCNYFPHPAQGRNDRKLKAIMAKYGNAVAYYVIFSMREILTESDNNKLIWTELEIELIAGDLNIETGQLRSIIEYAISLNYFQVVDQHLHCEELDNDLSPVYAKREKAKEIAAKQKRVNGQFATDTTEQTEVSVTETPQSKVEYSKVNKSKGDKINTEECLSEIAPDGVQADKPPVDIADYEKIEKTVLRIKDFIANNHPAYIEPYKDLWNLFASKYELSEIKSVSDTRKKKFKARIKEPSFNFLAILLKAKQSEFLKTSNWFGWDWIFENDVNYIKILEGNYDAIKNGFAEIYKAREKKQQNYRRMFTDKDMVV